jgi:hypothetical protein
MSMKIKHFLAGTVLAVGLATVSAGEASAVSMNSVSVNAKLTADNHYGLFSGNKDGSNLNFVGRNEQGSNGSTGGYNWSHAESWDFAMNPADYLYVVVWDDRSVDESWVGEFSFSSGQQLLSKPDDWEYVITQNATNPGDWGETPADAELYSEIVNANWTGAQSRGLNDGSTRPWGKISEVTNTAEFLNTTTNTTGNRRDNNQYTIFRTRLSVADEVGIPPESVPEPASTLGLLMLGVIGTGSVLKAKHK